MVGNLSAQDGGGHKGRHARQFTPGQGGFEGIERMLKSVDLTDDQKAKLAELKKRRIYYLKFRGDCGKFDAILTPEQKESPRGGCEDGERSRQEAQGGLASSHRGGEATDDQKAKLKDVGKEANKLRKEVRKKVMSLLTPEQKEALKKAREEMQKRRSEAQQ